MGGYNDVVHVAEQKEWQFLLRNSIFYEDQKIESRIQDRGSVGIHSSRIIRGKSKTGKTQQIPDEEKKNNRARRGNRAARGYMVQPNWENFEPQTSTMHPTLAHIIAIPYHIPIPIPHKRS